jgi:hypothetical protein
VQRADPNRTDGRDLTAQPIFEQRSVGDGGFSKACQRADFGTMPFGSPSPTMASC